MRLRLIVSGVATALLLLGLIVVGGLGYALASTNTKRAGDDQYGTTHTHADVLRIEFTQPISLYNVSCAGTDYDVSGSVEGTLSGTTAPGGLNVGRVSGTAHLQAHDSTSLEVVYEGRGPYETSYSTTRQTFNFLITNHVVLTGTDRSRLVLTLIAHETFVNGKVVGYIDLNDCHLLR